MGPRDRWGGEGTAPGPEPGPPAEGHGSLSQEDTGVTDSGPDRHPDAHGEPGARQGTPWLCSLDTNPGEVRSQAAGQAPGRTEQAQAMRETPTGGRPTMPTIFEPTFLFREAGTLLVLRILFQECDSIILLDTSDIC